MTDVPVSYSQGSAGGVNNIPDEEQKERLALLARPFSVKSTKSESGNPWTTEKENLEEFEGDELDVNFEQEREERLRLINALAAR